jgi:hypothetical protein
LVQARACNLTTQSRGPPHGHGIQIRSNRRPCVGPLFWLLGGFSKKQNKVGFSRFFAAVSFSLFSRQLAAFAVPHR